eukprot:349489-Amorphochlora_amoeboformis.AAC.1
MSVPVLKLGPDFLIFHPPSAVKTRNKLRIHGEALPEDLVRKSPLNYTEKMPKKRKFECAGEKSSEKRRELRREKGGVGMGLRMMPEEVFFGLCQITNKERSIRERERRRIEERFEMEMERREKWRGERRVE